MKEKDYITNTTIIIISYRSYKKIQNFLKNKPKKLNIIIIENSDDDKINKLKNKNIKIFKQPNKGISSSINYACKKVKTKYFFHFSPDIIIKNDDIKKIYNHAKGLKDNFGAIGPRFMNVNSKSHKQSNMNFKLSKISKGEMSILFILGLVLIHSFLAAHVLFSPQVTTLVSLILIYNLMKWNLRV